MVTKRDFPYVWVTWVSKLLSGDDLCEWASWFKANHVSNSYKKVPSDFDTVRWQIRHAELLKETRINYELQGFQVSTQNQNSIRLQGRTSLLSGIPDLIAVANDTAIVIDVKTGQHSPSHVAQLLIYMYALPLCNGKFSGTKIEGRIVYSDHEMNIPANGVDKEFISHLGQIMLSVADGTPPKKTPSERECGFCIITSEDCSERIENIDLKSKMGVTEDF